MQTQTVYLPNYAYGYNYCYSSDEIIIAFNTQSNQYIYTHDLIKLHINEINMNNLSCGCYANSKHIILSSSGDNTHVISDDGILWTTYSSLILKNKLWTSVCYGSEKYVAISSDGYCAYSDDLINWILTPINNYNWLSICYNNLFVAVSSNTTVDNTMISVDGINWSYIMNSGLSFKKIIYGNEFVAISDDNKISYSSNGIDWYDIITPTTNNKTITFGRLLNKDQYVIWSDDKIIYSDDLLTWNTLEDNVNDWMCSNYFINKYVAFSSSTITNNALMYIDITKTKYLIETNYNKKWSYVNYGNGYYVSVSDDKNMMISSDAEYWYIVYNFSNIIKKIIYGNGIFVFMTNYLIVYTTSNFKNFMFSELQSIVLDICYGNGIFMAVCVLGIYTSVDGIHWYLSHGSSFENPLLIYGGGKFVIFEITKQLTTIAGYDWVEYHNQYDDDKYNNIIYGNGLYIVVGDSVALISNDGGNWSTSFTNIDNIPIDGCAYGDGIYLIISKTYNYAYSFDGVDFIVVSYLYHKNCVCYGNGKFVMLHDEYFCILQPIDNTQINTIWDEKIIYRNDWNSICYGNNNYFVVGSSGDNRIVYSTNLQNWFSIKSDNGDSLLCDFRSVYYQNGYLLVIAASSDNNGNRLFIGSSDGLNSYGAISGIREYEWKQIISDGIIYIAIAGSGDGRIIYTFDNPTNVWITLTLNGYDDIINYSDWNSIAKGVNDFMVISSNTPVSLKITHDGINITAELIHTYINQEWKSICYGDGKYVAVSSSGLMRSMYYLNDVWTLTSTPDVNGNGLLSELKSVSYGSRGFMSVSNNGNINTRVITSQDGISWNFLNSVLNISLNYITYTNDQYVAISNSGYTYRIMTSSVCFTGNCYVLTTMGYKRISTIIVGDIIIENIKTKKTNVVCHVQKTNYYGKCYKIPKGFINNNDEIICTNHPLYCNNGNNRIYPYLVNGIELIERNDIFYTLQFEDEGSYYVNNVRVDSLSPHSKMHKLEKNKYINKFKYIDYCVIDEDDPIRNKPLMTDTLINWIQE